MSNSSINLITNVQQQYIFYSDILILTAGLISNIFLILIFVTLRSFQGNQCAFFLTVESFANICLLLTNLPSYINGHITGNDPTVVSLVWCKISNSLSQIFGICSLFTVCFLTFDQFLSTNPRPNWRQISTLKLAHRLTFFNICFVVLHSIPFFIFTTIQPLIGCTTYNSVLYVYFTYFYYPILSSAFPVVITVTFSLLAYRNVRRIVRRQIAMVRRRLDRQLTAMVLARVCCMIVLGLPYIIYSLYRVNLSLTNSNQLQLEIVNLAYGITYSFLYLNFGISFYLFLIVSTRFRRQVKHFLVKKCWNSLDCLCCMSVHHTNRIQVAPVTAHGTISSVESV